MHTYDVKLIRLKRVIKAVTVILVAYSIGCAASGQEDNSFNLTEVATGLYVHQGSHVALDHPRHDDIANIGFIVGEECVAVIDTGGSYRTGKRLRDAISQHTPLPIRYVINTHIHYDHVLGNIAFQADNPKFIGHKNLADAILRNRAFFLDEYGSDLGPAATSESVIGPTLTVNSTIEIDLGNRRLTLTAQPTAHTNNDLSVYDHKTNTLWLSDLLFLDRIPVLDGSLKGWLALIDRLKAIEAAYAIPGHGPVVSDWPTAIIDQERYLLTLLNQTRDMIAKGYFMEDVIETVGNEEKLNWLLHEQDHRRNVSKAFTELEWE